MKDKRKHRTGHFTDPDENGDIIVYCETCGWRDKVNVSGNSWVEGMTAIFAARDEHEASAAQER